MKKYEEISGRVEKRYERGEMPTLDLLRAIDTLKTQLKIGLDLQKNKDELAELDAKIDRLTKSGPPGISTEMTSRTPQGQLSQILTTQKRLEHEVNLKTVEFKRIIKNLSESEEKIPKSKTEREIQLEQQLEQLEKNVQQYQLTVAVKEETINQLKLEKTEQEKHLKKKLKEKNLKNTQILEAHRQEVDKLRREKIEKIEQIKKTGKKSEETIQKYKQMLDSQIEEIGQLKVEKRQQIEKQKEYQDLSRKKEKELLEATSQVTKMQDEIESLKAEAEIQKQKLAAKELENLQLREELDKLKSAPPPAIMPEPTPLLLTPPIQDTPIPPGNERVIALNRRMKEELKEIKGQVPNPHIESSLEPVIPTSTTVLTEKGGKKKKRKNKKPPIPTISTVPVEIKSKETPFPFTAEVKRHPKLKEYYNIIHKSGVGLECFIQLEKNALADADARKKLYLFYKDHHTKKKVGKITQYGSLYSSRKIQPIDAYIFALNALVSKDEKPKSTLHDNFVEKLIFASAIDTPGGGYPPAQYMLSRIYELRSATKEQIELAIDNYRMALEAGHPCANQEKLDQLRKTSYICILPKS